MKAVIPRALAVVACAAIVVSVRCDTAQAKYLVVPNALPLKPPQTEISASCNDQERSKVLAALSDLRAFSAESAPGRGPHETKGSSGLVMRAVSRGQEQYIVFHAERSPDAISNKILGNCLTIFAGSPAMINSLGLYAPDNTVPLGWFTYSRRLGIYADPRSVNLFPPKRI